MVWHLCSQWFSTCIIRAEIKGGKQLSFGLIGIQMTEEKTTEKNDKGYRSVCMKVVFPFAEFFRNTPFTRRAKQTHKRDKEGDGFE